MHTGNYENCTTSIVDIYKDYSGVNITVGTILEYIEIRIADRHHVFHRNNIQRESVV
jgi:hypothetical protein